MPQKVTVYLAHLASNRLLSHLHNGLNTADHSQLSSVAEKRRILQNTQLNRSSNANLRFVVAIAGHSIPMVIMLMA
jgi:hypothetical protein